MKRDLEELWREMGPYLDAVLELDTVAREVWLAELEGHSPAIAIRIRSQLRELADLEQENFLGSAAATVLAEASLAGHRFGSYTLERTIGHGGMGTVWLAHRNDGRFEGQAAVKLLNTALVGHPSERRFAREGSVLARLQHPNIAHLLDAGVAAGGQPYLVLEYIHGDRIDTYCEKNALSIEQRVTLFLDVLAAVAHAHSNLIVHRDLKPANILVTATGVVKLLDFGVAALLSPRDENATHLTHHIAPGLTPAYAAPEQLLDEPVTTATDVYSLGLVLFVLLVGRHPSSPEGKTAAELMRITLETDAPRASDVATDGGNGRLLRGDLDNIIATALRRVPAERYTTAELFAQDLRHYLALEPVAARPRSLRYISAKFVQRHRGPVFSALAVALVLIGAIVVTSLELAETRQQRDHVRFQSRRAEASNDFLRLMLLTDLNSDRPARTFYERMDLGVEMLNKQYGGDPQFVGRMLVEMGTVLRDNQETRRANELYAQAYAIGVREHDPELMVSAQCSRAFGEGYADVREGVLERLAEAQRLLRQIDSPEPELAAGCQMAQSAVEQRLGQTAAAGELLQSAKTTLEVHGSTHRQLYVEILSNLSILYQGLNQPREQLRYAQLAGEVLERNGRGGTDARLVARQNVATALNGMGETGAALAEREIINRRVLELESNQQEPLLYPINYATVLVRMARPEAALGALTGIVERARKSGNRFILTQSLLTTGSGLVELGRWDEADAVLKEAAGLAGGGIGNANAAAQVESWRAKLAFARGDLAAARSYSVTSLALGGYHTAKPQRALAKVLLVAAQISLAGHATADAEQYARDSLAITEPIARGADTSADVGEGLLRLAQSQISAGARTQANGTLARAVKCLSNGLAPDHPLAVEARSLLL